MNRITALIYSEVGEILGVRSGVEANVLLDIDLNEGRGLVVDPNNLPDDLENYYISSEGNLTAKGQNDSAYRSFDYEQAQWTFDAETAKQKAWNAIKREREAAEFSDFEWGGYTFQCDEVSQRRIQGAVQLAAIDPDMTLEWTLADNSVQTFTAAEYVQIGQALATHVSQCHERGRILRQEINQAATESELEAIVW